MDGPRFSSRPALTRRGFLLAVPVGTGLALVGCTDTASGPSDSGSKDSTVERGSRAESLGAQWPSYGHDPAQTRTNIAERIITADTVSRLTKAWEISDLVGVTGTPVVVDGNAYFADWKGQVWSVQAATGTPEWTTQVGGMFVGAPAIDGDALYVAVDQSLIRLNRRTGAIEWRVVTNDHPQAQINASPVVVDGLVIQGTASYENMIRKDAYLFRGSIGGFDAETGEQRWNFFATPADATAGAGAGIWSTPAIDTERALLYVGTGQGLSDPTPPLADSLIAIDYRSGSLKWSKQFTYPDVFSAAHPGGKDADVGASPNLWTSNGRDLVGAGDKGGTFHALDRETGEVVWETELTPGSAFGGQIGSAAFVDGTLVASSNVGDPETNAPTNVTRVFGLDPATGAKRWTAPELEGKIFAPISAVPGVAFCGTDTGRMIALDTGDGSTLWSADAPARTACGPSIVEGRVLWGYGFMMMGGPGAGGVISFEVAS